MNVNLSLLWHYSQVDTEVDQQKREDKTQTVRNAEILWYLQMN